MKTRFYVSVTYDDKHPKPKVEEHAMRPSHTVERKFVGPFRDREDAESYAKDPTGNARLVGTLEKARFYVSLRNDGRGKPTIVRATVRPVATATELFPGPFKTREGAEYYADNLNDPTKWLRGKPDVIEAERRTSGALVVPKSAPVADGGPDETLDNGGDPHWDEEEPEA